MRKITITTLAAALVSGGIAIGMAGGTASAHHPEIAVDTDCGDDGWTATYTVRSDAVRGLTWSVNGQPSKPDSEPFVFVESFDFSVSTDVFDATATWSNRQAATRSAEAGRPQGCQPPETTTTTSSTTIPVDPCSWPAVRSNDMACIGANVSVACGSISGSTFGSIVNQPSWIYAVWFSETPPSGPADGTPGGLSFDEDHNGGSTTVYYWLAGTENDVIKGGQPTWGAPDAATVETDCEQPETTTTTEAPTTTTEPPATTVTPTPSTEAPATTTTVVDEDPPCEWEVPEGADYRDGFWYDSAGNIIGQAEFEDECVEFHAPVPANFVVAQAALPETK